MNIKMKKLSIACCVASLMTLTACGGGGSDSPSSKPTTAPTATPTTAPTVTPTPQPVGATVDINFDMRHSVGGKDSFDRQKYITIHASHLENDWGQNDSFSNNAPNDDPNLLMNFTTDYDVYFGRDTGSIGWQLRNLPQDANRVGFVDEAVATTKGNDTKWSYTNATGNKFVQARAVEHRAQDMIVGAQQHPYWPEGTLINSVSGITPWSFSEADTVSEPLGTATGHYMGQFLAKYFKQDASNNAELGQAKPLWFEVMNEPLYDLVTDREGDADQVAPLDVFRMHKHAAAEIRKTNSELKIGGYTVAFPDFDKDNFQRWEDRDKLFVDTSGANMDFYSIHLYDFPCFQNSERYRRGSNVEATLDMLEAYNTITHGDVKPLVISEYGAAIHCEMNKGWSEKRNTYMMRSTNSMLMAFLERPDVIVKTIPFIVVKAEWGRNNGVPYGPRLMVQNFERDAANGDEWVYSDLVMFYDLWSEVNGTRIDTKANELGLLTDAYVDGNTAYVVLNNLDFEEKDINLNALGLNGNTVTSVNIKHLMGANGGTEASSLVKTDSASLPSMVTLGGEATMVIKVVFASDVLIDELSEEAKYYATTYKQAITANTGINFAINDVTLGAEGEAVLRLAVGRNHGLSLAPTISVNGTALQASVDWRGYDQKNGKTLTGRPNFFGVLEVSVPYDLLQADNSVQVNFADAGGYVASAALQVFNQSREVSRSATP